MSSSQRRFDVRTRDPELAQQEICTAYMDHSVELLGSTEDFTFRHTGVAVPGITVLSMHYSMAARMRAAVTPRDLIATTPTAGRLAIGTGGDLLRAGLGETILSPPDGTGWQVEMDEMTVDAVVVDRATVDRVAAGAFGIDPARLAFSAREPVSAASVRYWHSLVEHVRSEVLEQDELANMPLVLAEAARSLATALLVMFPNTGLELAARPQRHARAESAALRRALAYIDEHAGEDVGVEDIASAARIGVRGLQGLFRRHQGRTPLEQLRRVRLDRAHDDLRLADPTRGDTVAAIAARWGFGNPGRFSVQYRGTYGCSPSDTLRG